MRSMRRLRVTVLMTCLYKSTTTSRTIMTTFTVGILVCITHLITISSTATSTLNGQFALLLMIGSVELTDGVILRVTKICKIQ
jgi:hypothetical protein